jgi:hypothetical protein
MAKRRYGDYRDVLKAKGHTLGPIVLRTKKGRGHWRIVTNFQPAEEVK